MRWKSKPWDVSKHKFLKTENEFIDIQTSTGKL